jgi:hypothetical protein
MTQVTQPDPNALVAAGQQSKPNEGASEAFEHVCADGRVLRVREGKGRDAIQATRMCDGDQALWVPALLSILGTIDGQPAFIEDWEDLPLRDYMAAAAKVGASFI